MTASYFIVLILRFFRHLGVYLCTLKTFLYHRLRLTMQRFLPALVKLRSSLISPPIYPIYITKRKYGGRISIHELAHAIQMQLMP